MYKKTNFFHKLNIGEIVNIEKMSVFFLENSQCDFISDKLPNEVIKKTSECNCQDYITYLNGDDNKDREALLSPEKHTTFLYCNLLCEETLDVCCYAFAKTYGKVWLDEEIIICGNTWIDSICKLRLKKGLHTLVLEFPEWTSDVEMNIRFSPLEMEEVDTYSSILHRNNIITSNTILLHNIDFVSEGTPFEIMILPRDRINYKKGDKALVVFGNERLGKIIIREIAFCERCVMCLEEAITVREKLVNLSLQIFLPFKEEWKYDSSYGISYRQSEDLIIAYSKNKYAGRFSKNRYISSLDGKEELYHICIPDNYNENVKYPLFVFLSTTRYSTHCMHMSNYLKTPIIAADVTCRGITLGSYVGEVSIIESIEQIKNKYSIDEKRIYLVGYSNGASAAWAQIQAFPDLYAGALLISGYADINKLDNVNNLRVINVSSPYEYMFEDAWKLLDERLNNNLKYTGVLIDGLEHYQLQKVIGKEIFYDDFLRYSSELYPRKIDYYTTFNRHLKSYWVAIHSIEFGKRFAEIHVIANESIIKIETKNVSGFTINIPPYVNRENFTVDINGAQNNVINFQEDNLFFAYKDDLFNIVNKPTLCDYRKGTGILDVYLKPMVVITTDFNCADMVAPQFSKPISNGYNKEIFVSYPIYSFNEIDALPSNKSVVIIDNNTKSEKLNNIRQLCPIQMDDLGYYYKDQFCKGDYCVMQVFAHPENNEYTILYINTNNIDLYKKNFFTRKLILPSYMNGYHPYLNNEALIFDGKQYFRIYEWGQPIEPVSPN